MKSIKGGFWNKEYGDEKKDRANMVLQPPEGEKKYSEMLVDLIKPYLDEVPHIDDLEEMVNLGIMAWNMAVMTTLGLPNHDAMIKTTLQESGMEDADKKNVLAIINEKLKKYPDATHVIQEYELVEDGNGMMNVKLTSQPLNSFLASVENMDFLGEDESEEDDWDEEQYEEGWVNRCTMLVMPKDAFWEWVKQQAPSYKAPTVMGGGSVFLIPELEEESEAQKWLKKNFRTIYEQQLDTWLDEYPGLSPKQDYKTFQQFFTVRFFDAPFDTENEPVLKG
jgi:hypothetical protein